MNSIVHILSNIEIYIYQEEIYKISNIISFLGIMASQHRSNLTNLCRWNCYKWSQEILSKNVIFKGILSTSCVIFSYPKLLSISVLTFIKWRLTLSYVAKDTIFWQKRPKLSLSELLSGWQYSNLFIWTCMWTRLEHAHCLETINNMWLLGKRETVNAWKKEDFDGFRDKEE